MADMTKEQAIECIKNRMCWGRLVGNTTPIIDEVWQAGQMAIKALEERKQGKWIEHHQKISIGYKSFIECSCCQCWFGKWEMPRNSYCPNCGADMRGSKNDATK